jgi:hypothetical protein
VAIETTYVNRRFLVGTSPVAIISLGVGLTLQIVAYTALPVFALTYFICSGPYGVNPLPCALLFRTPLETALEFLQMDGLLVFALLFLLTSVLGMIATVLRSRLLKLIGIVAFFIWSGIASFLISRNIPAPSIQGLSWVVFLSFTIVGSFLFVFGEAISLYERFRLDRLKSSDAKMA